MDLRRIRDSSWSNVRNSKELKIADSDSPGFWNVCASDAALVIVQFLTIEERLMLLVVSKGFAGPVGKSFREARCIDTLAEARHEYNTAYIVARLARRLRPKLVFLAVEVSGMWSLAHVQNALAVQWVLQELHLHFSSQSEGQALMCTAPGGPHETGKLLRRLNWQGVGRLQVDSNKCVPPSSMVFPRELRRIKMWGAPRAYFLDMSLLQTMWRSLADSSKLLQQLRLSFSMKPVAMRASTLRYILDNCRHLGVLELTNVKIEESALFGNRSTDRVYPAMKALHLSIPPYFLNLDKSRCAHLVSMFPNMEVFSVKGSTITTVALEHLALSSWMTSLRKIFLNVSLDLTVFTRKTNRVRFPRLTYAGFPQAAFLLKENAGVWPALNRELRSAVDGCHVECWDPKVSDAQHHRFTELIRDVELDPVWQHTWRTTHGVE